MIPQHRHLHGNKTFSWLVCSWFPCLANTEGPTKSQQAAIPECFAFISVEMASASSASSSASGQKPECHFFIVSPPPDGDRHTGFFVFYFAGSSIQIQFQQFCVGLIIPIFIIACHLRRLSSRGRYGRNERGKMDHGGVQMDLNEKNRAGHDLHCGTLQGSSRSYEHNEWWHRNVHLLGSHRSPV